MTVILTICSANYLAHAKVLGDSLAKSNPDYKFVIGLVDCVPKEINLASWLPYEVIPVTELGIPEFPEMAEKYNIVELNTAVKPFYIEFLYHRNPAVEAVIYLDPDILVLGSFKALDEKLRRHSIVVTPHSCTFDNSSFNLNYEIAMLRTGIYNLGFIATFRTETIFTFLKWWQRRLVDYCYYRVGSGLFVDQLWVSLAPLYFDQVYVEKNLGYNMCYWNHFERSLSEYEYGYLVNGAEPLIFYHFSSYNPLNPNVIANRSTDPIMTFAERPDLIAIYQNYGKLLLDADFERTRLIKCCFRKKTKRTLKSKIQALLKAILNIMPKLLRRILKRGGSYLVANCGE